jgi:hypothetical protein
VTGSLREAWVVVVVQCLLVVPGIDVVAGDIYPDLALEG